MNLAQELMQAAQQPRQRLTPAEVAGYERRMERRRLLAIKAAELHAKGMAYKEIGAALRLTRQYAGRLVREGSYE